MKLSGYIKDKEEEVLAGADIFIMNDRLEAVYQTVSDEKGLYSLDLPAGKHPF